MSANVIPGSIKVKEIQTFLSAHLYIHCRSNKQLPLFVLEGKVATIPAKLVKLLGYVVMLQCYDSAR